jgi:hypothetical protein
VRGFCACNRGPVQDPQAIFFRRGLRVGVGIVRHREIINNSKVPELPLMLVGGGLEPGAELLQRAHCPFPIVHLAGTGRDSRIISTDSQGRGSSINAVPDLFHSKLGPRIPVVGVPFPKKQFLFLGFLMRLFAQMLLSRTIYEPGANLGVPSKDQLPLTHGRLSPRVAPSAALRAGAEGASPQVPETRYTVQRQLPRRDMW